MTTIASIKATVSRFYEVPLREMTSQRRERSAAHARQVGMYLARELTPHSLPVIGREFGRRDHTTVIHGIKAVEGRMRQPEVRLAIEGLRSLFQVERE